MQRVLLADADTGLLTEYRGALASSGYNAVTATNALECLLYLRRTTPNLVVMDSQIPCGATEATLALLRDNADLLQIPILVLDDPITSSGKIPKALSGYIILKKPVTATQLVIAVRDLLCPVLDAVV